MGKREREKPWSSTRKSRKHKSVTKKELVELPKPSSYSFQDIPVKVRRSLARRAAQASGSPGARPIFFTRQTSLSPLYDNQLPEYYLNQVFSSIEKIGQGCFGDVFQAVSKDDLTPYAIKVTNDTHSFIDLTEVKRLEKVPQHANCVHFYMAWQESYRLYIQMELCKTSLDKLLMVNHDICEPQCWDIVADISEGLKCLHDQQLIHLDIKPANIMISSRSICKLGDFGLLIDMNEMSPNTMKRTRTGISVSEGDGKYVAIEVLREAIYTQAGDIFSLGIVMLEVASDVALPSSGPGWEEIREGILPDCYYQRDLTQTYRQLINNMILKEHLLRPSIDDMMQNATLKRIIAAHKRGIRSNFMNNWDNLWLRYMREHPQSTLDIPLAQIQGPSPPRRPYAINYIRPSPQRLPLQDIEINLGEANVSIAIEPSSPKPSEVDARQIRGKKIARKLIF